MLPELSADDKAHLLALAKSALRSLYDENPSRGLDEFAQHSEWLTPPLLENVPCFSTLTTASGRLRGCVGSLASQKALYKNVYEYTRAAALKDPRFRPVQRDEIAGLEVHLSVLGPMERVQSRADIRIGEHGLYVRHEPLHGVLLADVATERKWDVDTFLAQTCEKAGLSSENIDDYEVFRFAQLSF
jgi:AmmeMemoRadiSam system protein A